jgi:hypothetical protein
VVCETYENSTGCQQIYDGCGHVKGSTPCLQRCKDCKKALPDTDGCKKRCRNCKSYDAHYQEGCIETSHEFPPSPGTVPPKFRSHL